MSPSYQGPGRIVLWKIPSLLPIKENAYPPAPVDEYAHVAPSQLIEYDEWMRKNVQRRVDWRRTRLGIPRPSHIRSWHPARPQRLEFDIWALTIPKFCLQVFRYDMRIPPPGDTEGSRHADRVALVARSDTKILYQHWHNRLGLDCSSCEHSLSMISYVNKQPITIMVYDPRSRANLCMDQAAAVATVMENTQPFREVAELLTVRLEGRPDLNHASLLSLDAASRTLVYLCIRAHADGLP